MMPYADVHFQLVDLPAISPEHPVPWLASALQMADAGLLIVDLGEPSRIEQVQAVHAVLREQRVTLVERWDSASGPSEAPAGSDPDPFALQLPTLMLANKAERIADIGTEIDAFRELAEPRYPVLTVSAATGLGLGEIAPWLFDHLGMVRVYTKTPGHPPDRDRPFTLRRGQTIADVAKLVHKDLARSFRYARVWGKSGFDGQQVGHEHLVADGDVVELHA